MKIKYINSLRQSTFKLARFLNTTENSQKQPRNNNPAYTNQSCDLRSSSVFLVGYVSQKSTSLGQHCRVEAGKPRNEVASVKDVKTPAKCNSSSTQTLICIGTSGHLLKVNNQKHDQLPDRRAEDRDR